MKKVFAWFKKHRRKSIIGLIALLLIFVVLKLTGVLPSKSEQQEITTVIRQDLSQTLSLSGEVVADEHVYLRFPYSGLVSWVGVKEGDTVRKYQAIASLDRRSLQKNLKKQLNLYATNRSAFEQTQDDYQQTRDNRLVTDEIQRILDQTQWSLENAVIDVELKDLAYRLASITTPISGIVVQAEPAQAGANVLSTSSVYEIVNPDTIYFSAEVDETEVSLLKVGQKAVIALDAFPDEEIESSVTSVSFAPVSGTSGTSYQVKLALPANLDQKYRLGFNGDVDIVIEEKESILVLPQEAVVEEQDRSFVQVSNQGQIETVDVVTGIYTDDFTEIVSGLSENDQVIIPD